MLVAVLAVAYWGTVRDHVEAWHFQMTRETETIQPKKGIRLEQFSEETAIVFSRDYLQMLSTHSSLSVIFDPAECEEYATLWIQPRRTLPFPTNATSAADWVLNVFRAAGCRIVEQRLPRAAYVVIRTAQFPSYPIVVSEPPIGIAPR